MLLLWQLVISIRSRELKCVKDSVRVQSHSSRRSFSTVFWRTKIWNKKVCGGNQHTETAKIDDAICWRYAIAIYLALQSHEWTNAKFREIRLKEVHLWYYHAVSVYAGKVNLINSSTDINFYIKELTTMERYDGWIKFSTKWY